MKAAGVHQGKAHEFSSKKLGLLQDATDFVKNCHLQKDFSQPEQLAWLRSYLSEQRQRKEKLRLLMQREGRIDAAESDDQSSRGSRLNLQRMDDSVIYEESQRTAHGRGRASPHAPYGQSISQ